MKLKSVVAAAFALSAILMLSSCASSERLMRMSGIIRAYEKPDPVRIAGSLSGKEHVPEKKLSQPQVPALDDSLVHLWPVFYRNRFYCSVLWPLIDSDPYGFAVRPFYNQEGNEYSVLFPLCAWNPVSGKGWCANAYWTPSAYGCFPFFHHSREKYALNYWLLAWKQDNARGVFPFLRDDKFLSYVGPFWKTGYLGDGSFFSGGIFPLAHFSKDKESLNYVFPFWKWGGTFGMFPLFRYRNRFDHDVIPLYGIRDHGKTFWSPLAGWRDDGKCKVLSVLGPLWFSVRQNPPKGEQFLQCLEYGRTLHESKIFLPFLLSVFSERYSFAESEKLQTARALLRRGRKFTAEQRNAANEELHKLDPALSLPESVRDEKSFRVFLADTLPQMKLETGKEWTAGNFPILIASVSPAEKSWISPALLSGIQYSKRKTTILSLPLLTYWHKTAQGKRRAILFPFGWMDSEESYDRNRNTIIEPEKLFEAEGFTTKWNACLLGLWHENEKRVVLSLRKGDARALNRARLLLGNRIRNLKHIRSKESPQGKELSTLLARWDLHPNPYSESDLRETQRKLYAELIAEKTIRTCGSWFGRWQYDSDNTFSRWHIGWLLANGYRNGDTEEVRILHCLYRRYRNGTDSETLYPFLSIQKNGRDSRISFLWRVWERKTVNGKTNGYICFIPYGERDS